MELKRTVRALDLRPVRTKSSRDWNQMEDHEMRFSPDMSAAMNMMICSGAILSHWGTWMIIRSTVETLPTVKWTEALACICNEGPKRRRTSKSSSRGGGGGPEAGSLSSTINKKTTKIKIQGGYQRRISNLYTLADAQAPGNSRHHDQPITSALDHVRCRR